MVMLGVSATMRMLWVRRFLQSPGGWESPDQGWQSRQYSGPASIGHCDSGEKSRPRNDAQERHDRGGELPKSRRLESETMKHRRIDDMHRSLASDDSGCVASSAVMTISGTAGPMQRVSPADRPAPLARVLLLTSATMGNLARHVITALKSRQRQRVTRTGTKPRYRKLEAPASAREQAAIAARRFVRCRSTMSSAGPIQKRVRQFDRCPSVCPAEPRPTTKHCDAPFPRRHNWESFDAGVRGYAGWKQWFAPQCSPKLQTQPLSEKGASQCNSGTCDKREPRHRRRSRSIVRRRRPISPTTQELQTHRPKQQSCERLTQAETPLADETRRSMRPICRAHYKAGARAAETFRNRRRKVVSESRASTEVAESRRHLTLPRVMNCELKQSARAERLRPASVGHQASIALRERRSPLRLARRRPRKIPYEEWRFDSDGQVRSLPGTVLKTSQDDRAAAGCCS